MKHTLSVLVENRPGALMRISSMFARRGFNIESLSVGVTERHDVSRITMRVDCEQHPLEQIEKQMHKLVNVLRVSELEPGEAVERELVLVKVRAQGDARARVIEIADIFRARVLDVTSQTATIEATGTADKLEALLRLLDDFGIVELARTGRVALARGERGIRERVLRAAGTAAPVERGTKRTKQGDDDEEYTGGGV